MENLSRNDGLWSKNREKIRLLDSERDFYQLITQTDESVIDNKYSWCKKDGQKHLSKIPNKLIARVTSDSMKLLQVKITLMPNMTPSTSKNKWLPIGKNMEIMESWKQNRAKIRLQHIEHEMEQSTPTLYESSVKSRKLWRTPNSSTASAKEQRVKIVFMTNMTASPKLKLWLPVESNIETNEAWRRNRQKIMQLKRELKQLMARVDVIGAKNEFYWNSKNPSTPSAKEQRVNITLMPNMTASTSMKLWLTMDENLEIKEAWRENLKKLRLNYSEYELLNSKVNQTQSSGKVDWCRKSNPTPLTKVSKKKTAKVWSNTLRQQRVKIISMPKATPSPNIIHHNMVIHI